MDSIFQQAPFDDKKDIRRIEEIAKEVEQRAKRTPGYRYDKSGNLRFNRSPVKTRQGFAGKAT